MAYDPKAESLTHLRRIVLGLRDFKGRSQRSELVVYLVAIAVLSLAFFVITNALPDRLDHYTALTSKMRSGSLLFRCLSDAFTIKTAPGGSHQFCRLSSCCGIYERAQFAAGCYPVLDA